MADTSHGVAQNRHSSAFFKKTKPRKSFYLGDLNV